MIDSQIIGPAISGVCSLVVGFLGGKGVSQHRADQKCERVCSLMLVSFEKLLVALEVVGEPEQIKHVIRDARDTVSRAKALMGTDGSFDTGHDSKK